MTMGDHRETADLTRECPRAVPGDEREEVLAGLVLACARGLGPADVKRLLARFGSYRAVVAAALEGPTGGVPPGPACSIRTAASGGEARRALETASAAGARYGVPGGPDYPAALHEIARPPVGVYVAGLALAGLQPAVAVVGTRTATRRGAAIARDLAFDAASVGLAVVSGLARGVDTAAHEGALEAGGVTVAVLGSGLSRVYPRENEGLARRIRQCGALVSEYPMEMGPRAGAFPARNRIIAGLSAGVLVVEAGRRSGALITAARALEEGREVFAVPGSITEPLSAGPNGLLKAGAKLVEGIEDVLDELRPSWGPLWDRAGADVEAERPDGNGGGAAAPSDAARRLLGLLTEEPRTIDELAALSGLAADVVAYTLLKLELSGSAEMCPGARYARPGGRVLRETRPAEWPGGGSQADGVHGGTG
ncbi:MAG: DNA-protecting protein DprA [Candidatus Eisenbacteria bacterium]|nr:DNA-protecting protein DprA [Candidatus Eisenbacteria bacterium]